MFSVPVPVWLPEENRRTDEATLSTCHPDYVRGTLTDRTVGNQPTDRSVSIFPVNGHSHLDEWLDDQTVTLGPLHAVTVREGPRNGSVPPLAVPDLPDPLPDCVHGDAFLFLWCPCLAVSLSCTLRVNHARVSTKIFVLASIARGSCLEKWQASAQAGHPGGACSRMSARSGGPRPGLLSSLPVPGDT